MYEGEKRWLDVDGYFGAKLAPTDEALDLALADNAAAQMPPQDVSPLQGKLLALLAKAVGARRILEVGTYGAYSTIWLARALPDGGKVVSLELSPEYAAVAARNLERAGVAHLVEVMIAPALDSLAQLHAAGAGPFDLVFIDADKPNNPAYLDWAVKLSRPGTLIVGDNVVPNGAVIDPDSTDDRVQGVRAFTDLLEGDARLFSTAMQTVGLKGWDGLTITLVEG